MKFSRLLGGAAVGVGAVMIGNRLLRRRRADLEPPLDRPQSTYRWRGFDVAYTEAGDPDDPDLLLLHGISAAASSSEYRRVVDALAGSYHVVAPDFPGFGSSDRPPVLYAGSQYVAFVHDVVRDLTDRPTIVASSLSSAYAVAAVADGDHDVERFVLICPTATTVSTLRPRLRSLIRTPIVGEALFNLIVSKPSIWYFLSDHGFADPASISEAQVDYDWTSAHQPGARFAPASFVSGFLDVDVDLGAILADLDAPTTVVWGRLAELPSLDVGRSLAENADARLLVFEDAALLPHVEHAEGFADRIVAESPPGQFV